LIKLTLGIYSCPQEWHYKKKYVPLFCRNLILSAYSIAIQKDPEHVHSNGKIAYIFYKSQYGNILPASKLKAQQNPWSVGTVLKMAEQGIWNKFLTTVA